MHSDFSQRFSGISQLYGKQNIPNIQTAQVAIIGLGGVGSWAAEALARSGVGQLHLFDLDEICISNTNRQIHALTHTIGEPKTDYMAKRLRAINPQCVIQVTDDFITPDNCHDYLIPSMDYVIDATDDVKAKAALLAHCQKIHLSAICCGGAAGQKDPAQIRVSDLSRTYNDPLLAKVRSRLRQYYHYTRNPKSKFHIKAIYSTEQLLYPQADGSIGLQKSHLGSVDCNAGFGTSVMVTATFGMIAAQQALEYITRIA